MCRMIHIGFVTVLTLLVATTGALADDCFTYVPPPMMDTSSNTNQAPTTDRAMQAMTVDFNGTPYLIANYGNDLKFFRITNPTLPASSTMSSWMFSLVQPDGDVDFNLFGFSFCDGCRYGMANYRNQGAVVFDAGTGSQPSLGGASQHYANTTSLGSFTFMKGSSQYLVANGLTSDSAATLYSINGVNESAINELMSLAAPSGAYMVRMGEQYGNYLYLAAASGLTPVKNQVVIVDVSNISNPTVVAFGAPAGNSYAPLSVDSTNGYLATASNTGAYLYDLAGGPMQPTQLAHINPPAGQQITTVTVRYPYLVLQNQNGLWMDVYDITVPTQPTSIDTNYWTNTSLPHNDYGGGAVPYDAAFSPDGSVLYLARHVVLQKFEIDCAAVSPVANVSVSPDPAFPGDSLTLSSISSGPVTSTWVWVTNELGATVAGDEPFGQQRESLIWDLSNDILTGESFTVHVAVAGDDAPYNPTVPGDQLAEETITIDRTPQATISVSPQAVITGDTVTLTASAEGHPSTGSEDSPYGWVITPPEGESQEASGQQVQVPLQASGEWCWDLDVQYQHEAQGGGLYVAEASDCLSISSVAAAFTVSPSQPFEGDEITLDGSSSVVQIGAEPEYAWTFLSGPTSYTGCSDAETCVIAPDTLESGTYQVRLQITNPSNGDTDTATETFQVIDDDINANFSFSPPSPEIGDSVLFTVTGVTGEIDQIKWYFGGSGCSGYTSPTTCVPDAFTDCTQITYKYSSGGGKSVHYEVWVNSEQYTSAYRTVNVAGTGSCDDCSYNINPTSQSFTANGGNGSISVQSAAGCQWSASSNRSWLRITSGSSGSGSGTVFYTVDQNTTTSQRSGTISIAGNSMTVTQSGGSGSTVDFTITDSTPDIGEEVTFTIASDPDTWDKIKWSFGGTNCDGESAVVDCGTFNDGCYSMTWRYRDAGTRTVVLTVDEGLSTQAVRSRTLRVSSSGTCVVCELDSPPDAGFLISPDEVAIEMPVTFTDTSTGQADTWAWKIMRGGSTVHSSSSRSFTYTFAQPGLYQISQTASNCAGDDTMTQTLEVFESLGPEEFVVPAAVHATGQNNTSWKTDMRVFNPCEANLDVRIDFLELGIDNSGPSPPGVSRALVPHQTLVLDDVLMWIPFHDENTQGSLRVTFEGPSSCTPVVMSRTYNDTPDGTYGQYVPAVAVAEGDGENLMLTGLAHNSVYRTNIGLANLSSVGVAGITIRVLDPNGNVLAEKDDVGLPPFSSVQVVNVAREAGVTGDLDLFSLEIDAQGEYVTAYASLIDNRTGDPVMYTPVRSKDAMVYLPGTAHVEGVAGSVWRSDMTLFNPSDEPMNVELAYHPEDQQGAQNGWSLQPKASLFLPDVVGLFRPIDDSKGYFTVSVVESTAESDASIQTLAPGFTWSPPAPSIGDSVLFTLTGVSGEVASVDWSFGDPGCGSQDPTCVASVWDDCSQKSFMFANAGPHSVSYTVHYTSGGQQNSNSQTVNVNSDGTCPGGGCTYAITPNSKSFDEMGGSGSVSVSTTSGCTWTASTTSGWIHITAGSSGSGGGAVSYTVDANSTSNSRNGTISVAGRTHTVYQTGAGSNCSYGVTPSSRTVPGTGGSGTFSVTTDSGCGWSASSTQSWLQITAGGSGSGSGTVTFMAQANPTEYSRTGAINIAGQTVYVTQEAPSSQSEAMPLVAARTYSSSDTGTFGQNIPAMASSQALAVGTAAYIPGVVASDPQATSGFRTNLGLINSGTAQALVNISFYADSGGSPIGFIPSYPIGAKQSVQFNIYQAFGMQSQTTGTLKLEVVSGGPVVAYGSVVDNRTQDPTFVPALQN